MDDRWPPATSQGGDLLARDGGQLLGHRRPSPAELRQGDLSQPVRRSSRRATRAVIDADPDFDVLRRGGAARELGCGVAGRVVTTSWRSRRPVRSGWSWCPTWPTRRCRRAAALGCEDRSRWSWATQPSSTAWTASTAGSGPSSSSLRERGQVPCAPRTTRSGPERCCARPTWGTRRRSRPSRVASRQIRAAMRIVMGAWGVPDRTPGTRSRDPCRWLRRRGSPAAPARRVGSPSDTAVLRARTPSRRRFAAATFPHMRNRGSSCRCSARCSSHRLVPGPAGAVPVETGQGTIFDTRPSGMPTTPRRGARLDTVSGETDWRTGEVAVTTSLSAPVRQAARVGDLDDRALVGSR